MKLYTNISSVSEAEWQDIEKRLLVLESLSKLTHEFATQPDFDRLVNLLILTVIGQFSVGSMFVCIREQLEPGMDRPYFGAGKFNTNPPLVAAVRSLVDRQALQQYSGVISVDDLELQSQNEPLRQVLAENNVQLLLPFCHKGQLVGLAGVGGKLNGRPLNDVELDLLDTLVRTMTPLLANSLLFHEIMRLNLWHLEILNSVQQGVFVFNNEEALVKINTEGVEILHSVTTNPRIAAELIGLSLSQVFPDSVFSGLSKQLRGRCQQSGCATTDSIVAKVGNGHRLFNVRVSSIDHVACGQGELVVTLDDVTVQREQECRLFDLEKYAEKWLMASAIAHELNNFLALLLGGVELVGRAIDAADSAKAHVFLNKLNKNINQMERFTAGLMDSTRQHLMKQKANLNAVISDVLAFATIQKRFRGIRIEAALDPALPEFEMDVDQIMQLLLNLLNNAVDAILEAKREIGEIKLQTLQDDQSVEIRVADNGNGMPPEVKDRLFQSRITTKETGHGYGLVTCAKIINDHQGQVEINSELGVGTVFMVRFPIAAADSIVTTTPQVTAQGFCSTASSTCNGTAIPRPAVNSPQG